jgi:hypothetical protein
MDSFMENKEKCTYQTRSARNTASLLSAPKLIYGYINFAESLSAGFLHSELSQTNS